MTRRLADIPSFANGPKWSVLRSVGMSPLAPVVSA